MTVRRSVSMPLMAVLTMVAIWMGCSKPGDENLSALNEAKRNVDTGLATLDHWNVDRTKAVRERVSEKFKDLDWLMADSSLTFGVDEGQIIGNWVRARRYLKNAPERITVLGNEGRLCASQLQNLIQAINSQATEDANGTPMDEAYFQRESKREIEAVSQWREAVSETDRMVQLGVDLEQSTRVAIDSLIRAKRAEWAQNIANPLIE